MNPTIRRRSLVAFTLGALAAFASGLHAADYYLQANSPLGANWNDPIYWWSQPSGGGTHPAAVTNADTFYVNGFDVRTPETASASSFAGGALVFNGNTIVVKQSSAANTLTIPALLSKGGSKRVISNGTAVVQNVAINDMLLTRSEITVFTSSSGTNRGLNVTIGNLRGDGDLNFNGGGVTQLGITTGSEFYGTIYVSANSTLTTKAVANLPKGNLVIGAGSKINLNHNITVSSAILGGSYNDTDRLFGVKRTGTPLTPNTTYTFSQLQAAYPAIFISGTGSITVTQPTLTANAANVVDNVGIGQLGVNLSAGKFWTSVTPNYRADLQKLKVGMIRTSVTPSKGFTLQDMDVRVAQIINAGGVPLFAARINKPAPPFTAAQQVINDNYLDLNGNLGGNMATNVAFLVKRYKAAPFYLTTQYWEVGNEPDLPQPVDYTVANPQEYIDIYKSVHNELITSGVRTNVKLCGPVVAAEYGFDMNYGSTDNILDAFFAQCAGPLNGHQQVDILTRHHYAKIYNWETSDPKVVSTIYNLLNHPTEMVSFTQACTERWPHRGEGAIQAKLRQYGFPDNVGTGITEFNIPEEYRFTITQGLWFLAYDHFSLYNPRNVLSSGFAFDIGAGHPQSYYSGGLPSYSWWATYVHNLLTGTDILEQHSSDEHLLVTATKDARYVYLQVLNRNEAAITANVAVSNAPVASATKAEMFVLSATELPDVAVTTNLGTSFTYTFPAMTTRVFRYLRSDAPPIVAPPGPPTTNVLLDTTFATAPTGMLTHYTGPTTFTPGIVSGGGDLQLTKNVASLTTAVVFDGHRLASSQKRMQARFGYKIPTGHAGSAIVFGAYSSAPGNHGAGLDGYGFYQQPNALFGVKIQAKGAEPDLIAITPAPVMPKVEGFAYQALPGYPWGYNEDMFVVIDYDGGTVAGAGTVRARLYKGVDDSTAPVADITNRVGNPDTLPAGTVFGFTSSTASNASQTNLIRSLKIVTDNGSAPVVGTPFTLQSWSSAPWSAPQGATSFSAGFSPGGVPVTMTFSAPKTGVVVTTPSTPNFTSAVNSYFGFESGGFGVANSTVGRFDRGESFTLQSTRSFALQQITWQEWTGDEQVHIKWTSGGVVQQQVFPTSAALQNFTGINVDANTPVIFTNVSSDTANSTGRLRINKITTALLN